MPEATSTITQTIQIGPIVVPIIQVDPGAVVALAVALVCGFIGSVAYLKAMDWGFMSGELIDTIRARMGRWPSRPGFALIGGMVALVFQVPQGATLAPIQAFVLGITWPFIVSQYVAARRERNAEVVPGNEKVSEAVRRAKASGSAAVLVVDPATGAVQDAIKIEDLLAPTLQDKTLQQANEEFAARRTAST